MAWFPNALRRHPTKNFFMCYQVEIKILCNYASAISIPSTFRSAFKIIYRVISCLSLATGNWTAAYVTCLFHYNDIIMGLMASQVTSLTVVFSTVYSGADQGKHQSSASLAFVGDSPVTGEFLAQMASNMENISIRWRHHVIDYDWKCCDWRTLYVIDSVGIIESQRIGTEACLLFHQHCAWCWPSTVGW